MMLVILRRRYVERMMRERGEEEKGLVCYDESRRRENNAKTFILLSSTLTESLLAVTCSVWIHRNLKCFLYWCVASFGVDLTPSTTPYTTESHGMLASHSTISPVSFMGSSYSLVMQNHSNKNLRLVQRPV